MGKALSTSESAFQGNYGKREKIKKSGYKFYRIIVSIADDKYNCFGGYEF